MRITFSAMAARARRRKKSARPSWAKFPLVPRIRETSDAGTPVMVAAPDGPEALAFLAVAEKVAAALKTADRPAPKIIFE